MLISKEYLEQQTKLHENPNYGVASLSYAPLVTKIINDLGIDEMLDYGAGKGRLAKSIKPNRRVTIELYDPAMPDYNDPPDSRQFVTCIDVLEHVEPHLLDNVLDDLQRVTEFYGFFTVHTGPAIKTLPDGRNAHLIQEDYKWWLPKFWERFDVHSFSHTPGGFYILVKSNGFEQLCKPKTDNTTILT